jgi:hypothetical protein
MNKVMVATYFMSLIFGADNGKGVNHNPLQLYGKFVSINKNHNFPFALEDHLGRTK